MKLKGKVIVVTGASQGLGKELVYQFSKEKARLILVARSEDLLKKIRKELVDNVEYFVCDIRDLKQVRDTTKKISKEYDRVDILINNAGVWTDNQLEKERPELRENALATNVLGHIQFTEELLPVLEKNKQATILNVISSSGVPDIPSGSNTLWRTYGASKWGMAGYSHALRESFRDTKIKVISYFPGGFDGNLFENAKRPNPHNQPWMMKTKDVAEIIVFALTRPDDVYMEKIVVSKKM